MCYYSQLVINPKYKKNQKNGGHPPPLGDRRIKFVPVGCGNCKECRKEKAREWMSRLAEDIKIHKNGKFVTLTFSNESIANLLEHEIVQLKKDGKNEDGTNRMKEVITKIKDLKGYERDNQIATRAVHMFRNRWRKQFGKSPRHWLITELGHNGTENIHLHGIIWTDEHIDRIREQWGYGWIWPRPKSTIKTYVNGRTVNYIVKYVSKVDAKHKEYKPIILTSPGIGGNYTKTTQAQRHQYNGKDTKETYKTSTGHEVAIPIYWRNKLYTEEERERLWIHKLDKETRWVNGIKYDISKTEDIFNQAVHEARKQNRELGYGGRVNENRKEHEENRRQMMLETRIKKYKNTSE